MELTKKVKNYIVAKNLLKPGDKVLLAVSGGVDSVVLAHIMAAISPSLKIELVMATFDHHLREESASEADFVEEYARQLDIPCFRGGAQVYTLAQGRNLEDVARRERYAFLRRTAYHCGCSHIATGHHGCDQAETVILHLLRGSGTTGLAGIAAENDDVIRPLLGLTREEIVDYAQRHGLSWREDQSNYSTALLRNRIRLELLPELKSYNPQILSALISTAEICREDDKLLDDMADNALAEITVGDCPELSWSGLLQLPIALRRRVLRKAFNLLAGSGADLSFTHIEAILALRDEQSVDLPHGFIAYRRGNLVLAQSMPELPVYNEEFSLIWDGCWHDLGDWGWAYQAVLGEDRTGFGFYLDEQTAAKARWRTRRPGDSVPSGGRKEKEKLKDIFIDSAIPRWQRAGWPVLVAEDKIRWVPRLWRCSDEFSTADRYVLIKVKQYDKINK